MLGEKQYFDEQERLARLALYLGLNLNASSFHRVLQRVGTAVGAFEARELSLKGVNLTPLLVAGLFEEAESRLDEARQAGLDIIIWGDDNYPLRLDEIIEPAPVLWVKGKLSPTDQYSVALVGSRQASREALNSARRLARDGARMGLTIVSGLAKGVDAQAHRGALEAGGRTLAVLGCGLNWVYPKENAKLYEDIAATGALISEFPPETRPIAANFPRRNRVIAGLSLAVVVVEAGERSGALITARQALELNREVMALPGPAGADFAKGANSLIKSGAALVEDMAEVMAEIKPRLLEGLVRPDIPEQEESPAKEPEVPFTAPKPSMKPAPQPGGRSRPVKKGPATAQEAVPDDSAESKVLLQLASGPKDADLLTRAAGLDAASMAVLLFNMELNGQLQRLASGEFQAL